MILLYNIMQILLAIIAAPLLFVKIILTPKYRSRIMKRLGIGLVPLTPRGDKDSGKRRPRIWIHALSVGEVSSARPLVLALRRAMPEVELLFSATTRTGEALAQSSLSGVVDHFIPYPLDFLSSVRQSLNCFHPDIFILVETDFWPNFLYNLHQRQIPAILVNGRISFSSHVWYKRFRPMFGKVFASFQCLAMQTIADAGQIRELGADSGRVKVLGNLKYDSALPVTNNKSNIDRAAFGIPDDAFLLVAGSTHPGEEEIILQVFRGMVKEFSKFFLVIAPRNIERGAAVSALAFAYGQTARRRTEPSSSSAAQVLILDTIGELAGLYSLCDIAFVGGSLVAQGGHNPLEPACFGKPVLFGPHMEDFSEIARDLLETGGALAVTDAASLKSHLQLLIFDSDKRQGAGSQARALVERNRGVADRHVELIRTVLKETGA